MKQFRISYTNGDVVGFHRIEEFNDYEEAYEWCVVKNKFGVVYPNKIQIKSI